jgi:DNA-binding transcriptional MocR family regulator
LNAFNVKNLDSAALNQLHLELKEQFQLLKDAKLNLDLTRGKPSADQLSLSNSMETVLDGNYMTDSGEDTRNYGGLDGLPEAKAFFAPLLHVKNDEILIGGNSSLTLMYQAVMFAHVFGLNGQDSAWSKEGNVKFLCPVPGYDRHFSICEAFGITMIPVSMNDNGPDMDAVEALIKNDSSIKGIWCVPRFSNPSGIVYSDETVERIAKLGKIAAGNFRVFWDNAYSIHTLSNTAPKLAAISEYCRKHGTEDSVLQFGSTSKITFAGAGVAYMGASTANLNAFKKHLGISSIGPDKINQLRHLKFFNGHTTVEKHMQAHADLLNPRFNAVLSRLDSSFKNSDALTWTMPAGGYFVSVDTQEGLAKKVGALAAELGVKLTPAGATFPYGKDPKDTNIRIAPSFPKLADIEKAMDAFVLCVKLATVEKALAA